MPPAVTVASQKNATEYPRGMDEMRWWPFDTLWERMALTARHEDGDHGCSTEALSIHACRIPSDGRGRHPPRGLPGRTDRGGGPGDEPDWPPTQGRRRPPERYLR